MYRLGDTELRIRAVWDALPARAGEELTLALADVCDSPWERTESTSDDPRDVRRTLTLQHTVTVLLIMDAPPIQRIYLRHISYLGTAPPPP